jgi:hypothetical protein
MENIPINLDIATDSALSQIATAHPDRVLRLYAEALSIARWYDSKGAPKQAQQWRRTCERRIYPRIAPEYRWR